MIVRLHDNALFSTGLLRNYKKTETRHTGAVPYRDDAHVFLYDKNQL